MTSGLSLSSTLCECFIFSPIKNNLVTLNFRNKLKRKKQREETGQHGTQVFSRLQDYYSETAQAVYSFAHLITVHSHRPYICSPIHSFKFSFINQCQKPNMILRTYWFKISFLNCSSALWLSCTVTRARIRETREEKKNDSVRLLINNRVWKQRGNAPKRHWAPLAALNGGVCIVKCPRPEILSQFQGSYKTQAQWCFFFFLPGWSVRLYTKVMKASEGPRPLIALCQTEKKNCLLVCFNEQIVLALLSSWHKGLVLKERSSNTVRCQSV